MNEHFNNFDACSNHVPCRGLNVGSVVIGGLFFYAIYRVTTDAVKNATFKHEKETASVNKKVLKTLKSMDKTQKKDFKERMKRLKLKEQLNEEEPLT